MNQWIQWISEFHASCPRHILTQLHVGYVWLCGKSTSAESRWKLWLVLWKAFDIIFFTTQLNSEYLSGSTFASIKRADGWLSIQSWGMDINIHLSCINTSVNSPALHWLPTSLLCSPIYVAAPVGSHFTLMHCKTQLSNSIFINNMQTTKWKTKR